MNDIFQFHEHLTSRYNDFSQGFNIIREEDIKSVVHKFLNEQKKFCPEPLIQLNMNYETGHNIHELVKNGSLHKDCGRLFVFGEEKLPLFIVSTAAYTGNYRLMILKDICNRIVDN
ncbi:MAG: hypothetical protein IJB89_02910 [Akkermansia sp.]|nr:hypothetical protein [Akkermansia sp.]